MKHELSTYSLLIICVIMGSVFVIGVASDDIDEICNRDNHTLYRWNGEWICGSLNDITVNYTINNITNLYNNYSLNSNNSIYWQGYTPTTYETEILNGKYLNLSGTNANQNINIGNYNFRTSQNITGNNIIANDSVYGLFFGNANQQYLYTRNSLSTEYQSIVSSKTSTSIIKKHTE